MKDENLLRYLYLEAGLWQERFRLTPRGKDCGSGEPSYIGDDRHWGMGVAHLPGTWT